MDYFEWQEDTQVNDIEIKAGDHLWVIYAAANRDPAIFDNPDDFLVDREMHESI
ncbi:MAG: hypothetical protein CM15mP49_05730 [Actinomycetota bacterium]|nr:MAG: hypothetical protein CM15mP49_05730 [Actinomycetota bacterium]